MSSVSLKKTKVQETVDMEVNEERRPMDALPDEVVMEALSKLEPADLVDVVPHVCRHWESLARERQVWQHAGLTFDDEKVRPWSSDQAGTPGYAEGFVRTLNGAPYLKLLDLRRAPTKLYSFEEPGDPLEMMRPVTPLVTEHGARLDRDLELRSLASCILMTGLPDLLRRNAGSLRRLELTHLYEVGPIYMDVANDWSNMMPQVADVMEAISHLVALERLELSGSVPAGPERDELLYRQADSMLLAALARLPALRELFIDTMALSSFPDWPRRQPVLQPGSMRLEVLEFDPDFSYVSDEILAELLLASSRTLRVLRLPYSGSLGPLATRALAQCRRLQHCRLPNLDRLRALNGLTELRHLAVDGREEETLTVEEVARSAALARLESLTLESTKPVALLDAIMRRCDNLRELKLDHFEPLANILDKPPLYVGPVDNPVVVLRLLEGAMPRLRRLQLDPARLQHSDPGWAGPLAELRARRPKIELL